MSILQYPDAIIAPELQIWDNAAFDNGESEDSTAIKGSWANLQFVNRSQSLESDCSKENQSPTLVKTPTSVKSAVPIKPLHSNNVISNSQENIQKIPSKQGLPEPLSAVSKNGIGEEEKNLDERKIDMEIEEIEREINRLSSKLEALRIEKAERNVKTVGRREKIVPAKFMEQKQSVKNLDTLKKIEESLASTRTKLNRRGVSLGPTEIFSGVKSRQPSKPEITPIQSIQSRRKSCFWKLQDIDEGKVTKERGKSSSLSPKSRKTVSKIQAQKQAVTTAGCKRPVKKEDGFLSSIQPKKLFKDGEKSVPTKKPLKAGRIIASRYNLTMSQPNGKTAVSDARKRSLPDNDKEDSKRCDKRRASLVGSGTWVNQSKVKKRWEIPSEVVVYKGLVEEEEEESPPSALNKADVLLPKIKTIRYVSETPRDSGAAKRVAELVGRKSYFCVDEKAEASVCQALSFAEEDAEEA